MMINEFKKWLIDNKISSSQTFVGKLQRIEKYEGNIEEHYKNDKCIQLLKRLTYSTADQNAKSNPLHSIPIESDSNDKYKSFYDGTRDYKSRLNKYVEFLSIFYSQEEAHDAENVENHFITWMSNLKKFDGEKYAPITVKGYTYYLKCISGDFFDDSITLNAFSTTNSDSFYEVRKQIKSHEKFKEINERCGKGQLSAGLDKYYDFLIEWNTNDKNQMHSSIFKEAQEISNDIETEEHSVAYYTAIVGALKELGGKGLWRKICDKIEETDELPNIHTTKSWRNVVNAYMQYKCSDSPKFQGKEDLFSWDKKTKTWGLRDFNDIPNFEPYTKDDFLRDIYMLEPKYDALVALIKLKKNVILQGAPGVGKSYLAQKLAYSIMGIQDSNRVGMIQFHQSYSYEDFIEGYRPKHDEDGFELRDGVFKEFISKAKSNPTEDFYYIIDEINRGNLSKIFGELMLLIENDKRSEKYKMTTTYGSRNFYVPENIHIIGLMNTADRSLAMLDYALRRRFSFVNIEPAFNNPDFISYIKRDGSELGDKITKQMTALNNDIEKDLGVGFKIGHSYFCNCNAITKEWYENILKYDIIPLLEEYWFDNEGKLRNYKKELLPNDTD